MKGASVRGVFVWKANPEDSEEFVRRWKSDSEVFQEYPGAMGTQLHRSSNEPGLFLGYATWESSEHRAEAVRRMKVEERQQGTAEEISEVLFAGFFEDPDVIVLPERLR